METRDVCRPTATHSYIGYNNDNMTGIVYEGILTGVIMFRSNLSFYLTWTAFSLRYKMGKKKISTI